MRKILIFIIKISLIFSQNIKNEENPENIHFVFEHFRHGARAPTTFYNNLDLFGHKWEIGVGELSENGYKQEYLIGLRNKNRYKKFIDLNYDPKEILIFSTNVNRTIASAQSQIMALFGDKNYSVNSIIGTNAQPPINISETIIQSENYLKSLPVPIHIYEDVNKKGKIISEKIMDYDRDVNCPKVISYRNENIESSQSKNFIENFAKKYEKIFNEFNITFMKLNSFKGSHKFCDAYISNYYENNTDVLDRIKSLEYDLDSILSDCFDYENFKQTFIEQGGKADFSGIITHSMTMRKVLNWMDLRIKINDNKKADYTAPKFVMYSGHDTTLASIQNYFSQSLNVESEYTPFASNMFLELRKYGDEFYVEYYFNDKLKFNDSYSNFKNNILKINWNDEKIDDFCVGYSKEEIWIIVLMCVVISLVIMCIALILFFCRYNKKYEFVEVVDANDNIQEKV